MKKYLITLFITFFILTIINTSAQNTVQIRDIELINLGDGQLTGQKRDSERTLLNGKFRIITGYTSEYIDAEFSNGLAIGKWEYYKDNNLAESSNYENGYENGEKIIYHKDGKIIKTRASMLNGKVEGTVVTYDSDGKKEYEKSVKKRDQRRAGKNFR